MYKVVVSKFTFIESHADWDVCELRISPQDLKENPLQFFRFFRIATKSDLLFISNPQFIEMLFLFIVKLVSPKLKVVLFDLILKPPRKAIDKYVIAVKRFFLSKVDHYLSIHKDLSGYHRFYGVDPGKSIYIPFKANNFDVAGQYNSLDGNYVVALGASQRDYKVLIEAMAGMPFQLKIIVPRKSILEHHAEIPERLPKNIEHVDWMVDKARWNKYISESRFVVVPILSDAIQPAGISVYLEAMVLGKPVVVTEGVSTRGILTAELAVLVPANDVKSLREALFRLWGDAELRSRLAESGKAYALSLSSHERLAHDVESFIAEILNSGRIC